MAVVRAFRPAVAVEPVRPPLKWAGGKRWQVPELLPLWRNRQHMRLVEPFCGGLAVATGLNPTRALLIDDPWLLLVVFGWVLMAGWIIYGR